MLEGLAMVSNVTVDEKGTEILYVLRHVLRGRLLVSFRGREGLTNIVQMQ